MLTGIGVTTIILCSTGRGVFGGLFLAFVDNVIGAGTKRKQLADHLVDYVENSPHFYKNVDKAAEGERADRKNRIVPQRSRLQGPGKKGIKGCGGNRSQQ